MRVLVCGGRDFKDQKFLWRTLDDFFYKRELIHADCVLIHGAARGADRMADGWARHGSYGIVVEPYPAKWALHGKAAGPIRNLQMLEEGKPDLVIAFPGGRGTKNMIDQARARGVPVEIVSYP